MLRVFKEIAGQEAALAQLERALRSGRLPHAYLFCGPRGVGKGTVARRLAQAALCESQPPADPGCGECPACRKVAAGNHPDVAVIQPDGAQIKIQQSRELIRLLGLRPYEGKRKVAIIEEAGKLGVEAANALLKTLEEPPGDSLLMLLGETTRALLPTIVSRCQLVRFSPVPLAVLAPWLAQSAKLSAADAEWLADFSGSSPGVALALLGRQNLAELRLTGGRILDALGEGPAARLGLAQGLGGSREQFADGLELMQMVFRNKLRESRSAEERGAWLGRLEKVAAARRAVEGNAAVQLAAEALLLALP